MTADPRIVYGADRIRTRYNVVDDEHPNGHHGQDFSLPAGGGSEVVAYEECVVVESGIEVTKGFTAVLGWYVVAKAKSDGRYLGWAHLRRGTRAALGKTLRPGDVVGLAASGPRPKNYQSPEVAAYDYPGTAWAGAHIHTTASGSITGIFSGAALSDPLPRIKSALVNLAASGGGYTPIAPAPAAPKEEDDMYTDADRARDNQAKAANDQILTILNARTRGDHGHILDEGDRDTILAKIAAATGAPHPTRNDYGRVLDAGDAREILNAIATVSGAQVDSAQLAKDIVPALLEGLGDRLVTDEDLAATRDAILTAIADVDEATLATFGLKRA